MLCDMIVSSDVMDWSVQDSDPPPGGWADLPHQEGAVVAILTVGVEKCMLEGIHTSPYISALVLRSVCL